MVEEGKRDLVGVPLHVRAARALSRLVRRASVLILRQVACVAIATARLTADKPRK